MARTTIPVTVLYRDDHNDEPPTTAVDAVNGMQLGSGQIWDASPLTPGLILELTQTAVGTFSAYFRAGTGPAAMRASLGDLVIPLAQNESSMLSLEAARFAQAPAGQLVVDFDGGFAGTIRAFEIPPR